MKNVYFLLLAFLITNYCNAQLQNPSFENGDSSSFEHWDAICFSAIPDEDAAPNSGDWSIKIFSGNTQGCIQPEYYQLVTGVNDGDSLLLSGWVKSSGNISVGLGLAVQGDFFPDTIFALATTGDAEWSYLSVTGRVPDNAGDSVIVFLHPGLTGGPIGGDDYYGKFDGLELDINPTNTSTQEPEKYFINLSPNPVTGNFLQLDTSIPPSEFKSLAIYNCIGREVYKTSEYRRSVAVNLLPKGIYFLKINTKKGDLVRTFVVAQP